MLNSKKVTIVIPTYNGEKYIQETIESCINQTYENINIVVIDDNSTDNTLKVIKQYSDEIKIIENKKNQGLPKNINQVILNDNSDFFIYLGHDDILPINHVELMLQEFESDTVGVHCNNMAIDKNGKELWLTRNNEIQYRKTKDILYYLSLDNFISIAGMMHRTSAFKKNNGWDDSYDLYGEWLYYINILKYGNIKYTIKSKIYYRIHDTNITKKLYSNKEKVQSFYKYKRRCRQLAYKNVNLSISQKFIYYKNYFFYYLRYIKALIKSVFK